MSRSHEEPLRSNNFQKVTPRRLPSSRQTCSLFLLFAPFSLLLLESRPHLSRAVFAVRQNTHAHTHTQENMLRPLKTHQLSLSAYLLQWPSSCDWLNCGDYYATTHIYCIYLFPHCFKYLWPCSSQTQHSTLCTYCGYRTVFLSAGDVCVSHHCTGVIFDKTSSLGVGHDGFKLGSGDVAGLHHVSREIEHLSH